MNFGVSSNLFHLLLLLSSPAGGFIIHPIHDHCLDGTAINKPTKDDVKGVAAAAAAASKEEDIMLTLKVIMDHTETEDVKNTENSLVFQTTELSIASTTCRKHRRGDHVLKEAEIIAKKLGIYSDAFYSGHHTMTIYIFDNAHVERAIMTTVWFSTLFFLDDFFGEDMQANGPLPDFKALFAAWTSGTYQKGQQARQFEPLFKAVAFCSHYFQRHSSKAFFTKYTEGLQLHLRYSLQPTDYRTMEEYIHSRIHFGGMYPAIGMIEFNNDIHLTDTILQQSSALQQAVMDCALIGVLSNDLISYHKEKHSQHNLINAYIKTKTASSLDEAIRLGINYLNDCHQSFRESSQIVHQQLHIFSLSEQAIIRTYLEGLDRLIAASYHWQMRTNRYRSQANIFADLRMPVE